MTLTKRAKTSLDSAVVDVWKRELGELSTRKFALRLAASQDLVLRLDILRKLDKHRGCVNTVSFNAAGDILVSGSDDERIILWNWETGQVKLSFHSGHENNVFQAMIIPYTNDRSIVTSAADGKVRHAQILESGVETKLLAEHHGRVHKLAVQRESPHTLYTCGEDGVVQLIDLRAGTATSLFTCKAMHSESYFSLVPLNAIAIDPRNPNLFAVGGSDQFARLYDVRRYKWDGSSEFDRPVDFFCPPHLSDDEDVGVTGLAFSDQSELLVSYNDEFIYLFTKDIGLGPDPTFTSQISDGSDLDDMAPDNSSSSSHSTVDENPKASPQAYKGHSNSVTVKGVNFYGPKCDYVVSGSDCGRIFIWKKKGGELVRVIEADEHVVNCIESHPHDTVLASSGIEHDIKIWIPTAGDRATLPANIRKERVHHIGLVAVDGFLDYDEDGDDFIDSFDDGDGDSGDGDDDYSDDNDDEDDDDEDDCDNCDNDNYSRNEEERDTEGDGRTDFILLGDADDNDDFGSENSYEDEVEDLCESDGCINSATSDDSFIDTYDIDDCSDSDDDDLMTFMMDSIET